MSLEGTIVLGTDTQFSWVAEWRQSSSHPFALAKVSSLAAEVSHMGDLVSQEGPLAPIYC